MTPPEIPPGYEAEAALLAEEGAARREMGIRLMSRRLFADLARLSRLEAAILWPLAEEGAMLRDQRLAWELMEEEGP